MNRVALYARYSSDKQQDASIVDQLRLCRIRAGREAWVPFKEYPDRAISGATLQRPGIQALLRDAEKGFFDIVLAESLDRFSRDQEDTAALFKRLTFFNVKIITLADGEITHLHVGLKGTMNALYLHDLADKTRRGLRGRIEAGKSGGGLSYGYRVVRASNQSEHGEFAIVVAEKLVVMRIFRLFADGVSAKAITKILNAEGVPGPRGVAWSPSTIHGHAGRGTGILNNELYVGRRVWNRQRYVKDPKTAKRVSRLNPREEWVITDVPHLRIIGDDLWHAVKARQARTRSAIQAGVEARQAKTRAAGLTHARRPTYLFSGLTKCGLCGGGYNVQSRDTLRCFNNTVRGTCDNGRTISRQEIEQRVLRAMTERFFDKAAFAEFCRAFTERWNERHRDLRAKAKAIPREIADSQRRQKQILEFLLAGFGSVEQFKDEVRQLEDRIQELQAQLTAAPQEEPIPALHPRMADEFRLRAEALVAGIRGKSEQERERAREGLRGFLDRIIIPRDGGDLRVVGNLGEMLTAASGWDGTALAAVVNNGCGGGI